MEIKKNHPLAPFTTVKIGGPAKTLIFTKSSTAFIRALCLYPQAFILGNGSNTLISDRGIDGVVIKNSSNTIEYLKDDTVLVDSGVQLPQLIADTINHNLSGLEEFTYIPSTIGGAIFGNIHGINKNNFNRFLEKITIFNRKTKKITDLDPHLMKWNYDNSEFKSNPDLVIVSAIIKLSPGEKNISKKIVKEILAKKTSTQSMNSLGSTFKNPPNDAAGRIIDQELGLKGFQIGDAKISPKHANFIVNLGQASAKDYRAVIDHVQKVAKEKLNLNLEPEIIFWGEF